MNNKKYVSCNSWVAVDKETHIAVWEFYSPSIVRKINADRYYVLTTKEYLYELNKQITKIEARW